LNVYISADIEGVTGLVSWSQCSRPNGQFFDYLFARRMMTHDVNAAIRGARAAGAQMIVVKDSHGNSKNLLVEDLEPGVELISGHGSGRDGMMAGITRDFDAAILVGYHAMAGARGGIMEHTITGGIHRLIINGREVGEIGLSMATAGDYGVPLVAVTSDDAGCREAEALVPGLRTVSTKSGLGRYMGQLMHPVVTATAIEEGVRSAVRERQTLPFRFEPPIQLSIEFNRSEEADMVAKLSDFDRMDGYTVGNTFPNFEAAHVAVWSAVQMSFKGIDAQH
jgi:D-amino peptidase